MSEPRESWTISEWFRHAMAQARKKIVVGKVALPEPLLPRREHRTARGHDDVMEGRSHHATARRLHVAPSTIRGYRLQILRKLGVNSMAHAVATYLRANQPREEN